MLELYYASESLCSQKVKLVLAEKDLEWRSHPLNLLTFENLQPSYIEPIWHLSQMLKAALSLA